MKSLFFLLFFTLMDPFPAAENDIKVMTFNIRYGTADDGDNSWPMRKEILFNLIRKENADFIGLQEAMIFQIEEIILHCPGYAYVGRTRQADGTTGEATPILYKSADYELISQDTQWLSETPEVPESKSWDTSLPRIFTWAAFRNKADKKEIIVYNTHYDHLGGTARHESSKVIVSHINNHFPDRDIILLGDLNALEDSDPISYLTHNDVFELKDSYREVNPDKKEKDMTYYGWDEHTPGTGRRIDYIFHAGNLTPLKTYVSDHHKGKRYPSDHMPVVAVFRY